MIECVHAELNDWSPDFSSAGLRNPTWTRVSYDGVLMCNSLEWTDWLQNPVQVVLCDACGSAGCATGGYVHVSRFGDHLLWTRPQIDASDSWQREQYQAAFPLRRFGAVAIPRDTWSSWRARVPGLPTPEEFAVASGRHVLDAWLSGNRGEQDCSSADELIPRLRKRLIASDSFDVPLTLGYVEQVLHQLENLGQNAAASRMVHATTLGARVEVLYFDGPSDEDWPAFAIKDFTAIPAFSRDLVLTINEAAG
jgi:hypothetical protein